MMGLVVSRTPTASLGATLAMAVAGISRVLFVGSLLLVLMAPGLHARARVSEPAGRCDGSTALAPDAVIVTPAAPRGAAHDPATCPQCAAIGQARSLVRTTPHSAPAGSTSVVTALERSAPDTPGAAPSLSAASPRAPPSLSL